MWMVACAVTLSCWIAVPAFLYLLVYGGRKQS